MASSSPGIILLAILLLFFRLASAEKNKHYHVASLCKTHFLQQLYRKIDGAVLRSQNEPNLDCTITFQTETILQKFMLRFDQLQLDCNDHLLVYDGAHAIGNYMADLSCRHTRQSVGTIYSRTNFLTLKYVTDAWGTDTNGFHLVITAFKDKTELVCRDFRCAQKDFCISTDLLCDGVNHCGDNTDETTTSLCADQDLHSKIFGLNIPVFGAVAGSVGAVLLCAIIAGIVICCCRRKRTTNQAQPVVPTSEVSSSKPVYQPPAPVSMMMASPALTRSPMPSVRDSSGGSCGYMTLPLKSAMSGNLDPPVVEQGQRQISTMVPAVRRQPTTCRRLPRICTITHNISSALYSDIIHKMGRFHWCLAK